MYVARLPNNRRNVTRCRVSNSRSNTKITRIIMLAGALVALLMFASPQSDQAHAQTATERIEYAENGTAPVVAYTAVDPEGSGIVWQLDGTDAVAFSLESGVLSFNSPPDFENPPQGNADNEYEVKVTASDGAGNNEELMVTIVVTNVDEPGVVTVPTQQPQEGVDLTVSLTDPDDDVIDTTWQWARSQDGSTGWVDIAGATQATYEPKPADVGTYLRATASYTDAEGKWKSAYMKAANPVQEKLYVNDPPVYRDANAMPIPDAQGLSEFVAEDASPDDTVGSPVEATDDARDTLTYELDDGADAASFTIDSGTGQIKVSSAAEFNFESDKKTYIVTVTAKDPLGATDMIQVTITVTDVDEPPTITVGNTVVDYQENNDQQVGVDYTASDPEDDDNAPAKVRKWSLSGPDASKFKIGNASDDRGKLSFKAPPDYEASASADRDTIYEVTVVVTDSDGLTDTRDVIVRVTNESEPGTVTLSNLQPEVGVEIMAELEDPDGVVGTVEWQWQAGSVDIDGATSPTFEPAKSHENQTITAKAMYTDGHGADKMADMDSAEPVQPFDTNNKLPAFEDRNPTRQVADGTVGDISDGEDNVGAPVEATDVRVVNDQEQVDDADLTYSLDNGTDAQSFTIVRNSGQIRVADGETIDYETKRGYTVTVTATDPSLASATARVTITVTQVDEPPIISGDDPGVYAENGTGSVADYNAVDPERARIVWTLVGADAGDFNISSTGKLTFNSPPDYENPADDNTDNAYEVTVEASDAGSLSSSRTITVTVTNVDEDGTIGLTARQPKVGVALTATLTDPDGTTNSSPPITATAITPTSWQWAKSTSASGPWTVINGETNAAYMPVMGDVGSYLRVTARYDDGEGKYKIAHEVSDNAVEAAVAVNQVPVFLDADGKEIPENVGITINVAEDTTAGMNVGAPVTASDADNDKLTYSLGTGGDNSAFAIDGGTGQIKVGAGTMLNFEAAKNTYTLDVIAADPSDIQSAPSRDSIGVTINVTNVDEDPSFSGPITRALFHAEDTGIAAVLATYTATDDEDGADTPIKTLKWSLAGTDAAKFSISSSGELKFIAMPDFEKPTDTGNNNTYDVTVEVTDSDGNTASQDVVITVTNVDEDGEVTFSTLQPQDGIVLTAKLTDPDGVTSSTVRWEWERAVNSQQICSAVGDSSWTDIQVADPKSPSYTPVKADEERCLRATASYTDGEGGSKSMPGVTDNWVQAADTDNDPPEFPDQDPQTEGTQNEETEISVDENTTDNVGGPVAAADDDDDGNRDDPETLTYTLGGMDAGSFKIDRETAQISVGAGTTLDFETKSSYSVTVTATDPSLAPATIRVTIKVLDVDEAPGISKKALAIGGRRSIDYPENSELPVATYTAAGPESAGTTWRLTGADSGDFSITGGVLAFRASPNYEAPVDSDRDNEYRISVQARDSGGNTAAREVTVRVANVDEDGAVTLSPSTARAGVEITAALTDLDGVTPGTVSWQWARSPNGASNWADIASATSNAYTPGNADADNYLRATASYTDGHGPGKSENAISANAVGGNNPPVFPASENGARSVSENAAAGTNIGAPVAARDPGDTLTYTLGGTDAASFDIVAATGQLQTRAALDAATKATYTVTVTATDTGDLNDTITVTINVVAENTPPVFPASESGARSVHEGATAGTNIGAPVAAQDPGDTLTYTLGGTDAASFDIVAATGQLQTKVALDAATKSTYTVTVTATDTAGATDTITVTITVTGSTLGELGDRYDANNNGVIERDEVITAIRHYFGDLISRDDVITIIRLYFTT